jgi:hypothetical protein
LLEERERGKRGRLGRRGREGDGETERQGDWEDLGERETGD